MRSRNDGKTWETRKRKMKEEEVNNNNNNNNIFRHKFTYLLKAT